MFSMMEKARAGSVRTHGPLTHTGPAEFAGPNAANCSYLEKIVLAVGPV